MKYKIFFLVAIVTFLNCCTSSTNKKTKIHWIDKSIFKYNLKIPSGYTITCSNDSLNASIQGDNMQIDFVAGDFTINQFTDSRFKVSTDRISKFEKIIIDSAAEHSSMIGVALWDTTTKSNLVDEARYAGCILGVNNVPNSQRYIIMQIFKSLNPQEK